MGWPTSGEPAPPWVTRVDELVNLLYRRHHGELLHCDACRAVLQALDTEIVVTLPDEPLHVLCYHCGIGLALDQGFLTPAQALEIPPTGLCIPAAPP